MQFDNKIRMKIITANSVMVIITVCHIFHCPSKYATSRCTTDTWRDCRKSPKIAIFTISLVIKSITYNDQNHTSRLFRQSLEIAQVLELQRNRNFISKC